MGKPTATGEQMEYFMEYGHPDGWDSNACN